MIFGPALLLSLLLLPALPFGYGISLITVGPSRTDIETTFGFAVLVAGAAWAVWVAIRDFRWRRAQATATLASCAVALGSAGGRLLGAAGLLVLAAAVGVVPAAVAFSLPWGAGRVLVDLALAAGAAGVIGLVLSGPAKRARTELGVAMVNAVTGAVVLGAMFAVPVLLADAAAGLLDLARHAEGWLTRWIYALLAFFVEPGTR